MSHIVTEEEGNQDPFRSHLLSLVKRTVKEDTVSISVFSGMIWLCLTTLSVAIDSQVGMWVSFLLGLALSFSSIWWFRRRDSILADEFELAMNSVSRMVEMRDQGLTTHQIGKRIFGSNHRNNYWAEKTLKSYDTAIELLKRREG